MYFHDISFKTQFLFAIYSFIGGFISGFFVLFLCSSVIKGKFKIIPDILCCILTTGILLLVNIAFQDAALRLYEVLFFLLALFICIYFFKRRSDRFLNKLYSLLKNIFIHPLFKICKISINKVKMILKKVSDLLYNAFKKIKWSFKKHGRKKCKKEIEKEAPL